MPLLSELARVVGGVVRGDGNIMIHRVAGLEHLQPGDLTLGGSKAALEEALHSEATAVIVPNDYESDLKPLLQVANPRLAFAQLLTYLSPKAVCQPGIHSTAVVGEGFNGPQSQVGPLVYIGKNVTLGKGTIIHAGAWIGDQVVIGEDSVIHGNVVIRDACRIGHRVTIHAGTVIGSDGFGYVPVNGSHYKIPQVGIVVIEDEVEIGANSAIDRATTGVTLIKRGTKVDNLVQIAHNCEIGANNLICGQAGLAGSSITGDRVTLAGKAGLSGHLKVGSDSVVAGCAKVTGDLPERSFVSGDPARPHNKQLRVSAALGRLPDLMREFKEMRQTIQDLQAELMTLKNGQS